MDVNSINVSKQPTNYRSLYPSSPLFYTGKVIGRNDNNSYAISIQGTVVNGATDEGILEIGKTYTFQKNGEFISNVRAVNKGTDEQATFEHKSNNSNSFTRLLSFFQNNEVEGGNAQKVIANFFANKTFPVTKQLVTLMSTPFEKGFANSLPQLLQTLTQEASTNSYELTNTIQKVMNAITIRSSTLNSRDAIIQFLQYMKSGNIGLGYENSLNSLRSIDQLISSLKPNLLQLLQETSDKKLKQSVQSIISNMNGIQLFSKEEGSYSNYLIPLLYQEDDFFRDWYVHITKKNRTKHQQKSDYTRVVFLLDLPNLSQTVVDLYVFQDSVQLTIVNEKAEALQPIVDQVKLLLKNNLKELGFELLQLKVVPLRKEEESMTTLYIKEILSPTSTEVDVRL